MSHPEQEHSLRIQLATALRERDEARDTTRLGGTHYKRVEHGVGIPGNQGNRNARTCGRWVEDVG